MFNLSETSAFMPAASGYAGRTKYHAAGKREIVAKHGSWDAATPDILIPGGDLEQVAFDGLALCDPSNDVHCGLTVVPASRAAETVAATDDLPVRVDWLQQELLQGPGLDARPGDVFAIQDLAANERWPDFGKMCLAVLNLRSMVSIRIPLATSDRASLNFYSSEPTAFEHLEMGAALRLARLTAPKVQDLISAFRAPLLGAARTNHSRVAIAVGTVMARYQANSSDAFDLLCAASHGLDRALLDVAIETVVNGRLPAGATIGARGPHRAASGPRQEQGRAATSPRLRHRATDSTASAAQKRARNNVHDGPPSVGGPGMWRDPSRH